jgi:OPA family glycerol-3-phosphate transporter-like MFS transporter
VTVVTLLLGYSGYYLCRSNLSVALPLLKSEGRELGVTQESLGAVMSVGVLMYALGKLVNGFLADRLDGRRFFLCGMIASVVCTIVFGLGTGLAMFAVAWAVNRFVQSMGWPALVKIAAHWFPASRQATVMGTLSVSYLLGDAVVRLVLGLFIDNDVGWRGVFAVSGVLLAIIAGGCWFTLRSTPEDAGMTLPEEAHRDHVTVMDHEDGDAWRLLRRLLTSEVLWQVCLMNFGLTLLRETFNAWTPTYLTQVVGLKAGKAAMGSLVFPLAGAAAVVAGGWLSDRCGGRHGWVMLPSLLLMTGVLAVFALVPLQGRPFTALVLLTAAGVCLLIPYSFCSGVMAIDLGGRRAGATACGIVDSAGYLGGALSGWGVAAVAGAYGWPMAFAALASITIITTAAVGIYTLTPPTGTRPSPAAVPAPDRKRRRTQRV